MIGHIVVRERGSTPRRMAKTMTAAKKASWQDTGIEFHANYREDRFTQEHAQRARYKPRSKAYREQKRRSRMGGGVGMALPLVKTGESRQQMRSARISSTSKSTRIVYRVPFYFVVKNARTGTRPRDDFLKFTRAETRELAAFFDDRLDSRLNRDTTTTRERLAA